MSQKITRGRCLCGQVTFEYEGPENWSGHCHCESCRRNTSSPFTSFLGVAKTAYRYTGKMPAAYESSPGVRRLFCATCGSPVAYESDRWPEETHFYAASLEKPEAYRPEFHVFWSEKVPWIDLADDLPKYDHSGD